MEIKVPAWLREISWSWTFIIFLAVVLWGGALITSHYENEEKKRLINNNLQLVKDNRELRAKNKKSEALEKCLSSSGYQLEPKD